MKLPCCNVTYFPDTLSVLPSTLSPHHGKYLGTPGMEVNAVVKLPLPCKRVFPIAVGRIDFDRRERIAYAEIACYLLFLFDVRT